MTIASTTQFTQVDRAPDASWCIGFMDLANRLPDYVGIRAHLRALLGDLDGLSVLEAGCGTGDDALELAAVVGGQGEIVAVDSSDAMVAEARHRDVDETVHFEVQDLGRLQYQDERFDAVWSKLVLMHCDDIDTVAAELVRVLAVGGRLAVFDYDFDTAVIDHPDRDLTRLIVRCASDGHPNNWSGRQLARRFIELGLDDVEVRPHTVRMSHEFYRAAIGGRLKAAVEAGQIPITSPELDGWWAYLDQADREGHFFAATTGFAVGGTKR